MKKLECLAEVSLQGDQALSFIYCTQTEAVYEVVGFKGPKITLVDSRNRGIEALNSLLATNDLDAFAPNFNTPALVSIDEESDGSTRIELHEPGRQIPEAMLWIVIGIRDTIPLYNYYYERIFPLSDETFAFIGLFEIPNEVQHQSLYSSEVSYSK